MFRRSSLHFSVLHVMDTQSLLLDPLSLCKNGIQAGKIHMSIYIFPPCLLLGLKLYWQLFSDQKSKETSSIFEVALCV